MYELLSGISLLVDMSLAANNSGLTGAGLDILVRLGFGVLLRQTMVSSKSCTLSFLALLNLAWCRVCGGARFGRG